MIGFRFTVYGFRFPEKPDHAGPETGNRKPSVLLTP
jgi:hypothetical protein